MSGLLFGWERGSGGRVREGSRERGERDGDLEEESVHG